MNIAYQGIFLLFSTIHLVVKSKTIDLLITLVTGDEQLYRPS